MFPTNETKVYATYGLTHYVHHTDGNFYRLYANALENVTAQVERYSDALPTDPGYKINGQNLEAIKPETETAVLAYVLPALQK